MTRCSSRSSSGPATSSSRTSTAAQRRSTRRAPGGPAGGRHPPRPLLGAHLSIAGGVDRALARAGELRCEAVQIFVKSNVRWTMPPLRRGEARRFASALAGGGVRVVFAHSSYLINLASADARVRAKSVASLGEELRRCAALGLPYLVLHPGAHGGQGERIGIRLIAAGLDDAFQADPGGATRVLLETTAGQGSAMGGRFEHLAAIIASSADPARLGVCLDTCHLFAAGYDLRSRAGYAGTMGEFERAVGLGRIRAFHLNDCMGGLGSRMDRHAHIGEGRLGLAAFARLLNDARFSGLPMVLETPKGNGTAFDRRNLAVLRGLLGRGAGRPAGARAAPSSRG